MTRETLSLLYASNQSLTERKRNLNWGQRIMLVPPGVDLTVLVARDTVVAVDLPGNVRVARARLPGRAGFLLDVTRGMIGARRNGIDVVVTDRSVASVAGWACRPLGGYAWIVDLWDLPHKELVTYYADSRSVRQRARRWASRVKVIALRLVLRRADLVLASVVPTALDPYRIPAQKLKPLLNAIEPESPPRVSPGRDPQSICFVSSVFLPDRGLSTLIEAVELLSRDRASQLRVRLVGRLTTEGLGAVERSAARERFELLGEVGIEEAHEVMRTSELGVIPVDANDDQSNIYPVKLLEYMLCGCVVVASDLPGIRTVAGHESHALLVPPGDAEALSAAIARALGDEGLRERLRAAAFARVAQLDAREKSEVVYSAIMGAWRSRTTDREALL